MTIQYLYPKQGTPRSLFLIFLSSFLYRWHSLAPNSRQSVQKAHGIVIGFDEIDLGLVGQPVLTEQTAYDPILFSPSHEKLIDDTVSIIGFLSVSEKKKTSCRSQVLISQQCSCKIWGKNIWKCTATRKLIGCVPTTGTQDKVAVRT